MLITSPFNLELNSEVWAKVVATNAYGDSPASEAGNGALTKLVPDAPVSLENNASITDAYNIGLTWQDGASDGGQPVLDYQIWWAHNTDTEFTLLATAVSTNYFTATETFVHGDLYKFKVQARNSVGYSLDSEIAVIRASRIPDVPVDIVTSRVETT